MEGMGAADMAFVVVPHPMGMIKVDEIRAKADAAFPEILKAATQWKPGRTKIPGLGKPAYPAETFKFTGTYEDLNEMFREKGWSLSLPIIPPTKKAVARMLKGTSHKPNEVVWEAIPPRMGVVTVEMVAVYGVMAGCKPQYMPLLLAIMEAMSNPQYNWRGQTTTTHPVAPLVLVNGPIRKELDIAYGTGALGPEHLANVSVGYFVNLMGDVIGGSVPPNSDKTDQGWVGNIIASVTGENEEANPWKQSYAEEKGFKKTDSVVTLAGGSPPGNNSDHASNNAKNLAQNISMTIAGQMRGVGCLSTFSEGGFLLLAPEHAATIAADGWNKDDLRKFLWDKARLPYWSYPGKPGGKAAPPFTCDPPPEFGPVTDDTLIPVYASPGQILIAVVGGPGKHSQFWDGVFASPVSVSIDKWR